MSMRWPTALALALLVAGCGAPPRQSAPSSAAPSPSTEPAEPATGDGPAPASQPRERFIVCPGDARCPQTKTK